MRDSKRRYRGCTRKRRHHSHGEALKTLRQARRVHHDHALEVYFCEFCGGYHIGHSKTAQEKWRNRKRKDVPPIRKEVERPMDR